VQYSLLEPVCGLSANQWWVCCMGPHGAIKFSMLSDETTAEGGLRWREGEWRAQEVCTTPDGHVIWRVHRGVAFRAESGINPFTELCWQQEARGVKALAVTDTGAAWVVTADSSLQYHSKCLKASLPLFIISIPLKLSLFYFWSHLASFTEFR
jgi:hypothetical protein